MPVARLTSGIRNGLSAHETEGCQKLGDKPSGPENPGPEDTVVGESGLDELSVFIQPGITFCAAVIPR